MDASDHDLCALDNTANVALTYQFSPLPTSISGNCSPVFSGPMRGVLGGPIVLRMHGTSFLNTSLSTTHPLWPGKIA
ncbi:hypothetical protein PHMEG_0005344 [Phytophthora megakarya]|uniref:Uncharacterized protein n=1 Tax=Phytophthora megakarya TaxID=4795 RepID=A0A225WT54_9STRA|nr:hypothetical protein PHMEG_0005344 [Phytophthora megakarya]